MQEYTQYQKYFDKIGKDEKNIVLIHNFIDENDLLLLNSFLNLYKNDDNFLGGKDLKKENIDEDNKHIVEILDKYEKKSYNEAKYLFTDKYRIPIVRTAINPTHFVKWTHGMNSKLHADCEKPDGSPAMSANFYKYNISMLMYPNSDYEGGQITFPDYDLVIKPEPGDFIMFPGNNNYRHTVEMVTEGVRYTMPSWYSFDVNEKIVKKDNEYTYQDSVQLWKGLPDFDKIDPVGKTSKENYEKSKMEG